MKYTLTTMVSLLSIALLASVCLARMEVSSTGNWPDSWPEELEQFRSQAKSYGVAHGIRENVHEIEFKNREDFERAWPHLLTLKTEGAALILEGAPSHYAVNGSTMEAGVRILAPIVSHSILPGGEMLISGEPWPEYLRLPSGGLPEYVTNQDSKWVDYEDATSNGRRRNRARVDIVLVVDGEIIDLNHLRFPADTAIVDRRWGGVDR